MGGRMRRQQGRGREVVDHHRRADGEPGGLPPSRVRDELPEDADAARERAEADRDRQDDAEHDRVCHGESGPDTEP